VRKWICKATSTAKKLCN